MARNLFELVGEIAVNGARAAESAIGSVNERAENLSERMDTAGRRVQSVGDSLASAGDHASMFSAAVAGAGGVVAGFVGKLTSMADETLQAANRLDISTESLQVWQQTARRFGIENEALRDGFKELQIRADEFAQTAKGPAAEAFERLGLSQKQVEQQSDDTVGLFNTVLDRIKDVESAAARQRILDELFGGQAAEQFPELMTASRKEIEKIQETVRDNGEIISRDNLERAREFQRTWDSFISTLTAVAQKVAIQVLPALESLLQNMKGPLADALQTVGTVLGALSSSFAALPAPMQQVIATMGLLAIAGGPVLAIFGRLISMGGGVLRVLARFPGIARGVTTAFQTVMAVGIRPILAVLGRFTALLSAFWAGWQVGKRVLLPLIEMFPRVDRAIENTVGFIAVEVPAMLRSAWGSMKSILSNMASGFTSTFKSIATSVIDTFSSMVSSVVGKAQDMWDALTRNSIIPDLADDAVGQFERMAQAGEQSGERMSRGMTGAMQDVETPRASRSRGEGGGDVKIDMSHSTFRDDRDMLERLRRKGSDVTGAFS